EADEQNEDKRPQPSAVDSSSFLLDVIPRPAHVIPRAGVYDKWFPSRHPARAGRLVASNPLSTVRERDASIPLGRSTTPCKQDGAGGPADHPNPGPRRYRPLSE